MITRIRQDTDPLSSLTFTIGLLAFVLALVVLTVNLTRRHQQYQGGGSSAGSGTYTRTMPSAVPDSVCLQDAEWRDVDNAGHCR